ncbi:MAG: glycosyltransferase family 2 protein [Cyanobium sp. LacPavin_0920_WC12_MAG_63_22]|nr:glycosyltransferase family 2 protein [Cyanobium sp. LacPavin_0920_WC12_MAG_63_22]
MTLSSSRPDFTICYPTYNRKDTITNRLHSILASDYASSTNILVSDNCSTDGTLERLKDFVGNDTIRVVQNTNYGSHFFGNIVNLFYECDTEWMVYMSDEDEPLLGGIEQLFKHLADSSIPCDVVVGSVVKRDKVPGSVRNMPNRPLLFRDLYDNFTYLSGTVINRVSMRPVFDLMVSSYAKSKNEFLFYWPHVALIWAAYSRETLLGLPIPCASREEQVKSVLENHREDQVVRWKALAGRWHKWIGSQDWMKDLSEESSFNGCKLEILDRMMLEHSRRMITELEKGISYERPEFTNIFSAAVMAECARKISKMPWPSVQHSKAI